MLPFYLSNQLCSLVPNEQRAAYVFEMKIDTDLLEVEQSKYYEAFIESKTRYSYEQIDTILENKSDTYFDHFYSLTQKIRKKDFIMDTTLEMKR